MRKYRYNDEKIRRRKTELYHVAQVTPPEIMLLQAGLRTQSQNSAGVPGLPSSVSQLL